MSETLDHYAHGMAADDVLATARFEPLSADDEAVALDRAVKIINRKHARRPQRAEDLHIVPAVMSTDALDRHFSRMDASTLKNYARDASAGVPFMVNHRTNGSGAELPLGHTYEGVYDESEAGRAARAGIYMVRNLKPNGEASLGTDDMMRAIDAGTTRDGSVSFFGGKSICDVCGKDVRDYECPHVPGTTRKTENNKIATYSVQGAHLGEFSGVFSGSNPGAMFSRASLDKTERAIVDKLIGAKEVSYLEDHYRLALSPSRTFFSVPTQILDNKMADQAGATTTQRTDDMKTKEMLDLVIVRSGAHLPEQVRKDLETTRATLTDDNTDPAPVLAPLERALAIGAGNADLLAQFRAAGVDSLEAARLLKRDGEDGRSYRADLVKEALDAGVAALRNDFPKEMYEKILAEPSRSLAEIKGMRDAWAKMVEKELSTLDAEGNPTGTGGRQTTPLHGFEGAAKPATTRKPGNANNFRTGRR